MLKVKDGRHPLMIFWVEMKAIRIPFAANCLDNSRNGIIISYGQMHPWEHHNMELFGSQDFSFTLKQWLISHSATTIKVHLKLYLKNRTFKLKKKKKRFLAIFSFLFFLWSYRIL
jgi:hypothetical protein